MLQRLSFNTLKQRKVNVAEKQGKGLNEGSRLREGGGTSSHRYWPLSPNRQPVQFCSGKHSIVGWDMHTHMHASLIDTLYCFYF